jgi:hypothetical protein
MNIYKQIKQAGIAEVTTPPTADAEQLARTQRALRTGGWGALAGAGVGALRAGLSADKEYLRDTLAGALLGGLGAGATQYISEADPFTRGGAPAKSFEAAKQRFLTTMLAEPTASPREAAQEALQTGLAEYLSGKHEFTPEEQKALSQQFIKAKLPTGAGWRKRIDLAQQATTKLQATPRAAATQLALLQKVAPDPEMQEYAGEALARLRSGAAATPEGRHALATLAQAIQGKLPEYHKATNVLDALNVMKETYGKGALTEEAVAKNLGLVTGRFGSESEEAAKTRKLVQQILASPVVTHPTDPYAKALAEPELGSLVERAMAR